MSEFCNICTWSPCICRHLQAAMFDADRWVEIDNSSLIRSLGFKDDYLIIKFHKGEVYRYSGAVHHFHDMLVADSIGRYFRSNILDQYSCQKIMGDEWPD